MTDDSVTALLLFLLGVVVFSICLICIIRCASRFAESRPLVIEQKAAAKGKQSKFGAKDGRYNDKNKDIEDDGEIIGEVRKDGTISVGIKKHIAKLIEDE